MYEAFKEIDRAFAMEKRRLEEGAENLCGLGDFVPSGVPKYRQECRGTIASVALTDKCLRELQDEIAAKCNELALAPNPWLKHITCTAVPNTPPGTLTVETRYDGLTLAEIMHHFENNMRGEGGLRHSLTPVQKAAASAEWSRQLREKTAEAKNKERARVVVDLDDD
jgi:hypothetical protein